MRPTNSLILCFKRSKSQVHFLAGWSAVSV